MSNDSRQHIADLTADPVNYIDELERAIAPYRYVVFYGCGMIYPTIVATWNEHLSRKIDFVCDSDPAKWGKSFAGIPCISPEELLKIKEQCACFISVDRFEGILKWLTSNGFPQVSAIRKYDIINASILPQMDMDAVTSNLEALYNILGDDASRKVFDVIIDRVFHGQKDVYAIKNIHSPDQYFPADIVRLSEHECLVDGGAFDGDSLLDFLRRTGGKFDRYYAFEIADNNYRKLQETAQNITGNDKIQLYSYGLGDCAETVSYSDEITASTVNTGSNTGRIDTLDRILKDAKVTFIKMDIEGYELKALKGAEKTIRHQKPTLAICIYHELNHFWEIPLYIKSLVPEYKIYLRHHTFSDYETVCYAVL